MAPASLLDCPTEVLLGIAELLSQSDLANLSMVCQALRRFTEPLVYPAFDFTWTREFYPPITKLLFLIRTLLERSDLCSLVRSLDFAGRGLTDEMDPYDSDWSEPTPDPLPFIPTLPVDQLVSAMTRTGAPEPIIHSWTDKIVSGSPEAAMAFVVSLLPNLKSLCVSLKWNWDAPFLGNMFPIALCSPRQGSSSSHFPMYEFLEYVSLDSPIDDWSDDWRVHPKNTAQVLSLLYLPNIRYLKLTIDNPTRFAWPYSVPPNPESLTSLEINRLRESRLAPILSITKNLRKLRYSWYYRSDLDSEVSTPIAMLDEMATAFLNVRDSLEELEVNASARHSPFEVDDPLIEYQGSLAQLSGMHKLRALRVPWTFLLGCAPLSIGTSFGASIPTSLQRLRLTGFQMWEDEPTDDRDERMILALEAELETGALSHAKSLMSVCLPGPVSSRGMCASCEDKMMLLASRFNLKIDSRASYLDKEGFGP